MPETITKPVAEIQREYTEFVESLDELLDKGRLIVDEINFGPELSEKGDLMLTRFMNAYTGLTALSQLLPNEVPDKLLA